MSDAVSTTGILVKRRPSPLPATVAITSSAVGDPGVLTFTAPHGLTNRDTVLIAGHADSVPSINGWHKVTVLSPTTVSIPVAITTGGTGGTGLQDFQAIAEITKVTPPGYSRNEIQTSNHNEGVEAKVLGILRQRNCAFTVNYLGDKPTHIAILNDIINNYRRDWMVEFPSGVVCGPAGARVQQFMLGDAPLDAAQTADVALSWAELCQIYPSYTEALAAAA
jgi:hypothetical protein